MNLINRIRSAAHLSNPWVAGVMLLALLVLAGTLAGCQPLKTSPGVPVNPGDHLYLFHGELTVDGKPALLAYYIDITVGPEAGPLPGSDALSDEKQSMSPSEYSYAVDAAYHGPIHISFDVYVPSPHEGVIAVSPVGSRIACRLTERGHAGVLAANTAVITSTGFRGRATCSWTGVL